MMNKEACHAISSINWSMLGNRDMSFSHALVRLVKYYPLLVFLPWKHWQTNHDSIFMLYIPFFKSFSTFTFMVEYLS